MPKGSAERTAARKEEIINACEHLYQTMSFKEITLKEISEETSFSRPSIYNYFHTKEEIFLALLQREYEAWIRDLDGIIKENETLTVLDFAREMSITLENREQLLKLMSMNHFDMEENSRMENLVAFKKSYGDSIKKVRECLEKFFPEISDEDKERFLYAFFPFMYGIYPYTIVSEKQREAMDSAGVDFSYHTICELAFTCIFKLLAKK